MIINEPGTYTITYTAEDECGNTVTETRELIVQGSQQCVDYEVTASLYSDDEMAWQTLNFTLTDYTAEEGDVISFELNGNAETYTLPAICDSGWYIAPSCDTQPNGNNYVVYAGLPNRENLISVLHYYGLDDGDYPITVTVCKAG